jgi:hypothetical protein
MRWVPWTILVVFCLFTARLYAQSSNRELTRRDGLLAEVFLKACDKLATTAVDFDGTGDPYHVEWRRCGSKNPNWDAGQFPVHYVLIRPPKNRSQVLALTLGNSGSSDEYFIDQLDLIDSPAGSRQLLLITGKYYEADQGKIQCVLELVKDDFQCSASIEPRYFTQQQLRVHEKSLLRKVGEYFEGR